MSELIKDDRLLNCPFCGGKAIMASWGMSPSEKMYINSDGRWHAIFCNSCGSSGNEYTSAEAAIKAWNRRYVCERTKID